MSACNLCPRHCGIDRDTSFGFCKTESDAVVNLYQLHFGEEPIISGTKGSGTVFFSGCNLGCIFCQNHIISSARRGEVKTPRELSDIYLDLMRMGANNINLVTPMHFAPKIKESILIAKDRGLNIPIAINTGSYDLPETLQLFDGLVDIYMPDFKFWSSSTSFELTGVKDYKERAMDAIAEMYRQVGPAVISDNGLMKSGVIVRHLILPSHIFDSKHILDYLTKTYGNNIYISLMNQYTPMPHLKNLKRDVPEYLFRTLKPEHYDSVIDYLCDKNQTNAFIQSDESIGDELIPKFI